MNTRNTRRLRLSCYMTNISMAAVSSFCPLLFVTFRELYGISYALIGLLVLINFATQLSIDLLLSFFSKKINIPLSVKAMPVLTVIGFLLYALTPMILPGHEFIGLVIATVLCSVSGGLCEVLISPIIAALPSENPDRDMSRLHSTYAWGLVGAVPFGTLFLRLVGEANWPWLAVTFALLPAVTALLFFGSRLPELRNEDEKQGGGMASAIKSGVLIFVLCIFLGGSSECSMSQWCSSFAETALGIDKVFGDLFGMTLFGAMLGLGRTLYAKFGKSIHRVLILGMIGAVACYLAAAFVPVPAVGLLACGLTGFCTSMLWPGSLIAMSERIPGGGVTVFALMASGGDLGAAVGPQLIGLVTDITVKTDLAAALASSLGQTVDSIAMRAGMLVGALFPLIGIAVVAVIGKKAKK